MNDPVRVLLHTFSLRFQFRYRPEFNIFRFIDFAREAGFHGVAISANDENYRHLESKAAGQFAKIKAHIQKHNLICDMDTSGTEPSHLRTMIEVATQIGARHLRTYTRYPHPEAIAKSIHDLQEIGEFAAEAGIIVLLENHETFQGAEIAHILTQVNHPHVQALYDYGNSQMTLETPLKALNAMAPFIKATHVKDHVVLALPTAGVRIIGVPLGEGNLPIKALTQRLYNDGLREFIFEDSRGYHAPLKSERLTPERLSVLGQDSFRYGLPPITNERYWFDTDKLPPANLIAAELQTLTKSWDWLKAMFAELDIPLAP